MEKKTKWIIIIIPVLSIIISIVNILVSSPLIIEYFLSPNVELTVKNNKNKETIIQMYALTNTGKKTATNVEIVFIMHNKYKILGVEALEVIGVKKQVLSLGNTLVFYKLSIDKIVPKEKFAFIIQGNNEDVKVKIRTKTDKENIIVEPSLASCKYDQGLCRLIGKFN
jgi:hypothetical protein